MLQPVLDAGMSAPAAYNAMLRVALLTATENLPGLLLLYAGMPLRLEVPALCNELGVTRGCPCHLVRVCLHPNEPHFSEAPTLDPHILQHAPRGIVLPVPGALFVLLSRAPSLDKIVFLRLPSRRSLQTGTPQGLAWQR